MDEIPLFGLDGKNPIGVMAALGALNVVSDHIEKTAATIENRQLLMPSLRWELRGTYVPVLVNAVEIADPSLAGVTPAHERLIEIIKEDLDSFRNEPAIFDLQYKKKEGKDGKDGKEAHDLKPSKGGFAEYLKGLLAKGEASAKTRSALENASLKRSLSFAAAFATDVALDNNENTKPTALHFTAGQQEFLAMVAELIQGVTSDDVREALTGPWLYERPLPVLQWDNAASRDYALRASDPSKDKKLGVPAAEWLAFRGLPFFKVAPVRDSIKTTGCRGEWKTGWFRWPLWEVPLSRQVVASLLNSAELENLDARVLEKRGVSIVFESAIRRSDQGGYGSFSPAKVA